MDAESRPSKRARPCPAAVLLIEGTPSGATELEPVRWPPRTSLALRFLPLLRSVRRARAARRLCALPETRPREARLRRPELEGLARLPAACHESNCQGGPPARRNNGRCLATAHLGCKSITAEAHSRAAFTEGRVRSSPALQRAAFEARNLGSDLLHRITAEPAESPANSDTSSGSK